jgi:HPt (histidine-containing phosphotransfer) domain-containing protein
MPAINGVELCHALREKYNYKTVFVALTAHVFAQEKEQLMKEGFDIILSKPFREEEFLQILGINMQEHLVHQNGNNVSLDLSILKQITMGDESLFQSILHQFREETEKDLQRLEVCLKNPNTGEIREIIHKLAGRVGQMGASTLSSELRDIETELVEGTPLSELMIEIMDAKIDVASLVQSIDKSSRSRV